MYIHPAKPISNVAQLVVILLAALVVSYAAPEHSSEDRLSKMEDTVAKMEDLVESTRTVLKSFMIAISDADNQDRRDRYKRYAESNDSEALEDVLNGISVNGVVSLLRGRDGRDGIDGVPGFPGRDGATGPQGEPGAAGSDGEAGAPGEVGAQGLRGIRGLAGTVGTSGRDGLPGTAGSPGAQGAPGVSGLNGPPGTCPSSCKPAATTCRAPYSKISTGPAESKCVLIKTTTYNWTMAKNWCETNGAYLLTFGSKNSTMRFGDYLAGTMGYASDTFWIGGYRVFDHWYWVGTLTGRVPENGAPDAGWHNGHGQGANDYCMYYHTSGGNHYGWNTHAVCSDAKKFICEKPQ